MWYSVSMKSCTITGCTREARSFKVPMCPAHKYRHDKGLDMTKPIEPRRPRSGDTEKCDVRGCDAGRYGRSYCRPHERRAANGKPMNAPIRQVRPGEWGNWCSHDGYRIRYRTVNGKRETQWEHRLVLESMLGRELLPGESPHHKNGVRSDNRPENLELWVSYQPSGQRPEDLLEWADEIIARYR